MYSSDTATSQFSIERIKEYQDKFQALADQAQALLNQYGDSTLIPTELFNFSEIVRCSINKINKLKELREKILRDGKVRAFLGFLLENKETLGKEDVANKQQELKEFIASKELWRNEYYTLRKAYTNYYETFEKSRQSVLTNANSLEFEAGVAAKSNQDIDLHTILASSTQVSDDVVSADLDVLAEAVATDEPVTSYDQLDPLGPLVSYEQHIESESFGSVPTASTAGPSVSNTGVAHEAVAVGATSISAVADEHSVLNTTTSKQKPEIQFATITRGEVQDNPFRRHEQATQGLANKVQKELAKILGVIQLAADVDDKLQSISSSNVVRVLSQLKDNSDAQEIFIELMKSSVALNQFNSEFASHINEYTDFDSFERALAHAIDTKKQAAIEAHSDDDATILADEPDSAQSLAADTLVSTMHIDEAIPAVDSPDAGITEEVQNAMSRVESNYQHFIRSIEQANERELLELQKQLNTTYLGNFEAIEKSVSLQAQEQLRERYRDWQSDKYAEAERLIQERLAEYKSVKQAIEEFGKNLDCYVATINEHQQDIDGLSSAVNSLCDDLISRLSIETHKVLFQTIWNEKSGNRDRQIDTNETDFAEALKQMARNAIARPDVQVLAFNESAVPADSGELMGLLSPSDVAIQPEHQGGLGSAVAVGEHSRDGVTATSSQPLTWQNSRIRSSWRPSRSSARSSSFHGASATEPTAVAVDLQNNAQTSSAVSVGGSDERRQAAVINRLRRNKEPKMGSRRATASWSQTSQSNRSLTQQQASEAAVATVDSSDALDLDASSSSDSSQRTANTEARFTLFHEVGSKGIPNRYDNEAQLDIHNVDISPDQLADITTGLDLYSEKHNVKLTAKYDEDTQSLRLGIPTEQPLLSGDDSTALNQKYQATFEMMLTYFKNMASDETEVVISGQNPLLVAFAKVVADDLNNKLEHPIISENIRYSSSAATVTDQAIATARQAYEAMKPKLSVRICSEQYDMNSDKWSNFNSEMSKENRNQMLMGEAPGAYNSDYSQQSPAPARC